MSAYLDHFSLKSEPFSKEIDDNKLWLPESKRSIVDELVAQGLKILVLSTTNAALDQALEKIVREPAMAAAIASGKVVRIGRSDAPTFGAGLREVVSLLNDAGQKALNALLERRPAVEAALRRCG